ncbi:MAG TPA: DHH family phosphoesterase, partial [Candidatus Omnitrophota bacterium]|nr:DHH family phosphoesterase [Candidatus Omnitrophota bacterium]
MNIQRIIQAIKNNKTFLISTHVNPDPDGLCSQLALASYLRSLGKKVYMINEEEVPMRFRFIKGISNIRAYHESKKIEYDLAIILDCGELKRIGKVKGLLKENKPIINIDHHVTNTRFGDLKWIDVQASSTTEIIYLLMKELKGVMNKDIAIYLY